MMLSSGRMMPVSLGREARINVGRDGCARIVPSLMGPSDVKVKSGGRNQVGIVSQFFSYDDDLCAV